MNKLRQYITERPKLKRLVKILCIVAILFSFLFNTLVISSLIINANQTKDDNATQVLAYGDYNPVKSAVLKENYKLYSMQEDIVTRSFINSAFAYEDEYGGFGYSDLYDLIQYAYRYGVNDAYQDIYPHNGGSSIIGIFGWYLTYEDYRSDNEFAVYNDQSRAIKSFRVKVLSCGNMSAIPNQTYYISECSLQFTLFGLSNNHLLDYNFNAQVYFSSSNVPLRYFINYTDPYLRYILVNETALQTTGSDIMYNLYMKNSIGYKQGYSDGYSKGFDEGSELDNNPFNLLKSAFDSITNILNIQVLPNLTLGVLIFTPLIVTIIIVVVKMFRS